MIILCYSASCQISYLITICKEFTLSVRDLTLLRPLSHLLFTHAHWRPHYYSVYTNAISVNLAFEHSQTIVYNVTNIYSALTSVYKIEPMKSLSESQTKLDPSPNVLINLWKIIPSPGVVSFMDCKLYRHPFRIIWRESKKRGSIVRG